MAGEVIVDALPYIDQGYDEPGIREAVIILLKYFVLVVYKNKIIFIFVMQAISMVEDEKRRYRPSKNYLEHLPPLNISAFEACFLFFY